MPPSHDGREPQAPAPDVGAGRGAPLWSAHVAAGAAAVLAPLAHAALLADRTPFPWLTLAALAAGLLGRPLGAAPVLAGLVVVAPLWQALVGTAVGSADIHLVMPWLAAVAACLATGAAAGWRTPRAWAVPLAAWALVVAFTWPVAAARELDFTTQTIGAATGNGLGGAPPRESAALVMLAAEAQLVAILLFNWMWGAVAADRRRVWAAVAPGLILACLVALWQGVSPAVLSTEPWIGLRRSAGPFFDANAMGALAGLFGPALAARAAVAGRPVHAAFWLVLSLAGVVASGSRTSLAAWVAAGAVLLTGAWRGGQRRWAAIAVVAALAVGLGLARLSNGQSEANAVTRLVATTRIALADGVAGVVRVVWTRQGFGPAAMAMIAEHPWVGVGPGVFSGVVAEYSMLTLGILLPADNAQNWWRHQWAELGTVGALGAFVCSWLTMRAALLGWRRRHEPGTLARTAPLVAIGLMAVVSPPTQHPILQVLVGLLLAECLVPLPAVAPAAAAAPPRSGAAWTWAVWTAAVGCAAALAVEGWTSFRPPYRASRFHVVYNYGFSGPERTPFGEGRWAARRAVAVFGPGGRTLVVRVALPHDDLAAAPVHVTVWDGHDVTCARDVRDQTPFECRLPVPAEPGRWPMVQIDVSRAWTRAGGREVAAFAAARFEP